MAGVSTIRVGKSRQSGIDEDPDLFASSDLCLRGPASPSSASDLSVDSGVDTEGFTSDEGPTYENMQFFGPTNRKSGNFESLTAALSIDCSHAAPPPPKQFADAIEDNTPVIQPGIASNQAHLQHTKHLSRIINEDHEDDYEEVMAGENLSLILTAQNPSRIDVQTLRKNKVDIDQPVAFQV